MSHDCEIVYDLWTQFGKTTTVDRNNETACCYWLGVEVQRQPTVIPEVYCTPDGNVTRILWRSRSLSGYIPDSIGNLELI